MRPIVVSLSAVALGAASAVLVNCRGEAAESTVAVEPADAQSEAMVAAAEAFLATLAEAQRGKAQFAWPDEAQRANWSNFPNGVYARAGVDWAQLDEAQRTALMTLLGTVLSPAGLQMVRDQMAADDVLASQPQQGPPGGGPPGGARNGLPPGAPAGGPPGGGAGPDRLLFGSGLYFVSFVGKPSTTAPWLLQFGGHHLAINATVVGPNVTLAPSLTGGQPLRFTALDNGRQVDLTRNEIDAAHALLAALTPEQRQEAIRSGTGIDLMAGPQQDSSEVPAEGIAASKLDEAQQAKLLALIESRLGLLNADDFAAAMADVRHNLAQTTFGWWGPTEPGKPAYWRVVAPTLVLEYSPQQLGRDGPAQHVHNMYRWPGNDYGAAWTS